MEVSGGGVLIEFAVEDDEVLGAARRCVVTGRWAAGLDLRVGRRCWGDDLEAAVPGGRRPKIRSSQEYGKFQLQLRSGSGSEKVSGLTRHEERSKPRRPMWTMGRRRVACKPNREVRQYHGGLLGAGRRFGDVVESRDVAYRSDATRVDGNVLDKTLGRRERGVAMPRWGLGLGRFVGRRERREAVSTAGSWSWTKRWPMGTA